MNRRSFLKSGALWVPPLFAIGRASGAVLTLADPAMVGRTRPVASASLKDLTSDAWQNFEFDTMDTSNLGSNDHITGGTWAIGGSPTTSTSGQYSALFTYGGTTDTGTRGLAAGVTAENRVEYEWASTPALATMAFWFYSGSLDSGKYSYVGFIGTGKFSAQAWLLMFNTSGTHALSIEAALSGSQTSGQAITISPATWYWVVMLGQNATTCKLSVFDTSGSRVGVERTCTGAAQNSGKVGVGTVLANTTTAGTHYFDNWVFENSDKYADFAP